MVVSTHKSAKIEGITMLLLEKINPATMEGKDDYVVAADGVGAGTGEIVFYASGSCGRYTEVTLGKPSASMWWTALWPKGWWASLSP